MDKPTEHQPLDNLFRRKLNNASVQPDTESWSRLQGRLTGHPLTTADKPVRRIGAIWYWSVSAAAACLLLTFLWGDWNGQPTNITVDKGLSGDRQVAKTQDQQTDNQTIFSKEGGNKEVAKASVTETKATTNALTEVRDQKRRSDYVNHSKTERPESILKPGEQNQVSKATDRQPITNENKPEVPEKDEVRMVGNSATQPALSGTERTLIVSVAEPASEQIVINQVQPMPSATVLAPVKNARIARVFRQIKRLKDGEAIARVDIHVNETEDESGLVSRLVQATRSKENQSKQQKQ